MVAVQFTDTVNLSGVLILILLSAMALLFTLRSRLAQTWKDEAEAERVARGRLERELAEFKEQQRELRHELKIALAATNAELEVEKHKHDLTGVLNNLTDVHQNLTDLHDQLQARTEFFKQLVEGQKVQLAKTTTAEEHVLTTLANVVAAQERCTEAQERTAMAVEALTVKVGRV